MAENNKDNLFEQYGFSVEENQSSSPDFGGFLSGDPVTVEEVPEEVVEEYIAPADAPVEDVDPDLNYMENMQNMFRSLSQDTTEPPVEKTAEADPEPEYSSFVLGKEGDEPVKSQQDLLSSETRPFRGAPSAEVHSEELPAEEKGAATEPGPAGSEQQVNETMSEPKKSNVEKGEEYWSFVDSLLDNFDDTKVHAPRPRTPVEHVERAPRVTAEEAAAAVAAATAPAVTTKDSDAEASEAKSSGEAPAAGGYFLKRRNSKEAAEARRSKLSVHDVEDTVLPVLPEEPVVETPVVEAPVVEETVAEAPVPEEPEVEISEVEIPAIPEIPEVEVPAVEETVVETPVVEAPVVEEPEVEAPVVENQFFKTAPLDKLVSDEAEFAPVPAEEEPEEPVVETPTFEEEPKLTRAEKKALKKAEKQAAKEAKEAEKLAAKEAKLAAKAEPAEVADVVAAPAAPAAAAAIADFDEDARNAEFDATYVEPKKGGVLKIIRNLIVTLAALAIVACIAILGYHFVQQKMSARQFTQASTLLTEGESAKDLKAVQKKYPDVTFPEGMQAKFGELYALNQDLSGWISVPGTDLNYPVVQTDNDSFYQNHNFTKAVSDLGTPFLSSRNDAKELDLNNVVYGQSSDKEPRMFSALEAYRDKAYFLKHPVLAYSTLYEDYLFKVYAFFVTNSAPEQDNGYVFDYTVPNLGTVESFAGYVDQLNERRLYDTGVDIQSSDRLLTLSTSTGDFDGARLVVVGRLLREDESKGVDKTLVKTNKAPHYPQAWYDAAGKTNPYTDADKWIPTIS